MTWLLDGAEFVRTERPDADAWAHRFSTPRGEVVVAWARRGRESEVTLPGATRAWDLMGGELTPDANGQLLVGDTPVYVLVESGSTGRE